MKAKQSFFFAEWADIEPLIKNAKSRLREGWRLVTNDRSPKEYDLQLG